MNAASVDRAAPTRTANLRRARKDVGQVVALLATPDDFDLMRERYRSFRFTDYDAYLSEMQALLDSLARNSGVYATLLDPDAFATFCAAEDLEPDSPTSRARYAVGNAIQDMALPYTSEDVMDVIEDLTEVFERRSHSKRAVQLIGAGSPGELHPRVLVDRAAWAIEAVLNGLGTGRHHLVCSVTDGPAGPLVATLHAHRGEDGQPHLPEEETLTFTILVAAGLREDGNAGVVARTTGGEDEPGERVRAWSIRDGWLRPLAVAEVFSAYCTDPKTGEPIPPEYGVEYLAGFPIDLPEG